MQFTIPLKPLSVSKAWQGRRFKTQAYKQFERDCALFVPKEQQSGQVEVSIEFFVKNVKRIDVDNMLKTILDVLTKCGVYEDDSNIYALHVYKEYAENEQMRVTITPYD